MSVKQLNVIPMSYGFQVVTSVYFPKDTEASPGGVDDMTKLSYLHEPGVLQNLETRYELNHIYVSNLLLFFVAANEAI